MSDRALEEDDFDLACWYINQRRVAELIRAFPFFATEGFAPGLAAAKDAIIHWLRESTVHSLGQLLTTGTEIKPGMLFTHHDRFYCRGLSRIPQGAPATSEAEIYAKLDDFQKGLRVSFRYQIEHLVSTSSWVTLQGQVRLFVFGVVSEISDSSIVARPLVIASIVYNPLGRNTSTSWLNYREVWPGQIDQFSSLAQSEDVETEDLEILKTISETQVKTWFAEIVGEGHVPRDWGGESSDLFTTSTRLAGMRVSTAFLFKGPAHFQPLTMRGLGKNEDQVVRLFSEPADLLVLQHCHRVTAAVRATMRAFANQISNPRRFSIIDGLDTLRILLATKKLQR
jgi:hypothetical protein